MQREGKSELEPATKGLGVLFVVLFGFFSTGKVVAISFNFIKSFDSNRFKDFKISVFLRMFSFRASSYSLASSSAVLSSV
jgi:hypothetical protein